MKNGLLIISLFVVFRVSAQKETSNWVFGDSLLMSFTDAGIICTQIPSKIMYEASASISDEDGNLLFYTDGKYVWNRLHEVMPNGCCLNVDQYGDIGSSITQGAIILPAPGSDSKYYIFIKAEDSICYNLVDMSLDDGLGDVVLQNQPVYSGTLMEKMHAVKHANGRDWWLLVHEGIPSFTPDLTNTFYVFLVTPFEIQGPFMQPVGLLLDYNTLWGEMIFSPDGSNLALSAFNAIEIFNFDRCTGQLTELCLIDNFETGLFSSYGTAFSPDGNKIYVSNFNKLYQYCLNCKDDIEETKVLLFDNPYGGYSIGQHELGSDNKIYFTINYSILPNTEFTFKNMNLCVINEPNLEGFACDIDTSTIWLGGRRAIAGLPNMVNYNLGALVGSDCDTLGVAIADPPKDLFTVFPNPVVDLVYFQNAFQNMNTFNLQIINSAGVPVYNNPNVVSNQPVNLKHLPPGVYTFYINDKEHFIQSGSIVKIE